MTGADANYVVEVEQRFKTVGLDRVVDEYLAALQEIASRASKMSPQQTAAEVGAVRQAVGAKVQEYRQTAGAPEFKQAIGAVPGVRAGYQQIENLLDRDIKRPSSVFGKEIVGLAETVKKANAAAATSAAATSKVTARPITAAEEGGAPTPAEVAAARISAVQDEAATRKILSSKSEYSDALAKGTKFQAITDAQTQGLLAESSKYTKALASTATSKARQQAQIQEELAGSKKYTQAQAQAATSKARQQAQLQEELAGNKTYVQSQARIATANDRRATAIAQELSKPEAVQAFGQRKFAEQGLDIARRTEVVTQRPAGQLDQLAQARALEAVEAKQLAAKEAELLNADNQYAQATVKAALERDRTAAKVAELSRSEQALSAATKRALEEQRTATAERAAKASGTTQEDVRGLATADAVEIRVRTQRAAELARMTGVETEQGAALATTQAATAAAERRRAVFVQEATQRELAADDKFIESEAAGAEANRLRAARVRAVQLGVGVDETQGLSAAQAENVVALQQQLQATRQRIALIESGNSQEGTLEKELAAANEELIAAKRAQQRTTAEGSLAAGQGSLVQRLQSRLSLGGPNPRAPSEFQGLGGLLGSKALTSASYAIPGALLYGGVSKIRGMVDEAQKLEREFNQIEAQFNSLGEGSQFAGAKKSILELAQNTGIASDEVANVFFQFKGAFGDTQTALNQTSDAMKTVQVTGLSVGEVLDSLTATSKTFSDATTGAAKPISELTNVALAMQEQFGVAAKETLTFVADLAPVGKQAGATAEELAGLGAVSNQLSGRPGSALAESYARVLPALDEARDKILALYNAPNLKGQQPKILEAFASGNTFDVFKQLLADSATGKLTKDQQDLAISFIGSRREAQALIPAFTNAKVTMKAMEDAQKGIKNGKLDEYMDKSTQSVKVTMDRMREAFSQLGQAVFQAGLGDILRDAAQAAGLLGNALSGVGSVLAAINSFTSGASGKLLAFIAACYLANKAIIALGNSRLFSAKQAKLDSEATTVETATTARLGAVDLEVAAAEKARALSAGAPGRAGARGAAIRSVEDVQADAGIVTTSARRAERIAEAEARPGKSGLLGARVLSERSLTGEEQLAAEARGRGLAAAEARGAVAEAERSGGRLARARGAYGRVGSAIGRNVGFEPSLRPGGSTGSFLQPAEGSVLPAATFALIAAGEIKSSYDKTRAGVQAEAKKRDAALQKASNEDLKKLIADKDGFFERASAHLFGQKTNFEAALKESSLRRGAPARTNLGAVVSGDTFMKESFSSFLTDNRKQIADAWQKDIDANLTDPGIKKLLASLPPLPVPKGGGPKGVGAAPAVGAGGTLETSAQANVGKVRTRLALSDITLERVEFMLKEAAKGDTANNELLGLLEDFREKNGILDPEIEKLLAQRHRANLEKTAGGKTQLAAEDFATAQTQFQSGVISGPAYMRTARASLATLEAQRDLGGALWDDKARQEYADVTKGIRDYTDQRAKQILETVNTLTAFTVDTSTPQGQFTAADQKLRHLESFANTRTAEGLNAETPEARGAQLQGLMQAAQERFVAEANQIVDPVTRLAKLKRGFKPDATISRLFAIIQLQLDPGYSEKFAGVEAKIGPQMEKYQEQAVDIALKTGEPVNKALADILQGRLNTINAIIRTLPRDDQGALNTERNNLIAAIATLRNGPDVKAAQLPNLVAPPDVLKANEDTKFDLERQRIERQKIALRHDAVASAELDVRLAKVDLEQAQAMVPGAERELALSKAETGILQARAGVVDARHDAQRSLLESQAQLAQVYAAQNGGQQAAIALQLALAEQAIARPDEAGAAAVAVAQALKQGQDYADQTVDSAIELQIAQAEAAGEVVRASKLKTQEIAGQLARARSRGAGVAEINAIKNQYVAQQAQERQTIREDRLSDLSFMYDMGKITVTQYIKYLQEVLKTIPATDKRAQQDILRQIHQLRDDLGGDLSLDIPGEIKLPTLYEARRFNQQTDKFGQGTSYQDNRQINIVVNEATDGAQALQRVVEAINSPPRSGLSASIVPF